MEEVIYCLFGQGKDTGVYIHKQLSWSRRDTTLKIKTLAGRMSSLLPYYAGLFHPIYAPLLINIIS